MWRFAPAGDRSLLVTLGAAIDAPLLAEVLALERDLRLNPPAGLLGAVPAYASLLCQYDPAITTAGRLADSIRMLEGSLDTVNPAGSLIDVPTRYDGPDMAAVATSTGLKPSEVIEVHSSQEYLVYCVGFAPGFTYCGALPEELVVPRLAMPRTRVPAGSIGIAGRQTGIYAVESPGGWNLIGRTALSLFDPTKDVPVRFKPGDRTRFVPTS